MSLEGPNGEYYYDSGEEWADEQGRPEFLFLLHNGSEDELLAVARDVAGRQGVSDGVYVTINEESGKMGDARSIWRSDGPPDDGRSPSGVARRRRHRGEAASPHGRRLAGRHRALTACSSDRFIDVTWVRNHVGSTRRGTSGRTGTSPVS